MTADLAFGMSFVTRNKHPSLRAAALQQQNKMIASEVQAAQNRDAQLQEASLYVQHVQAQNASLQEQLAEAVNLSSAPLHHHLHCEACVDMVCKTAPCFSHRPVYHLPGKTPYPCASCKLKAETGMLHGLLSCVLSNGKRHCHLSNF